MPKRLLLRPPTEMGQRGLILATLPAMAFGAGYVAGGALGVRARWSRRHHDEAWVIIGLAILSVWQIRGLPRSPVGRPLLTLQAHVGRARRTVIPHTPPPGEMDPHPPYLATTVIIRATP